MAGRNKFATHCAALDFQNLLYGKQETSTEAEWD
jgi:hypothetical protein